MKIILAMFGKPKDKRILEIMEEYAQKISRFQKFEYIFLPLASQGGRQAVEVVLQKFEKSKFIF